MASKKRSNGCNFVLTEYKEIKNMLGSVPRHRRYIAHKIVRNCLSKIGSNQWLRFFKGTRVDFPYYEMESVVSAFYEDLVDTYVGVDSILPSDFISKVHPYLLASLARTLNNTATYYPPSAKYCYGRHIVRILPISQKALQDDYDKHKIEFAEYCSFHKAIPGTEQQIMLLWAKPSDARKLSDDKNLWTTDIGLWIRYCALLFQAGISPENNTISLQLVNPLDRGSLFGRCVEYIQNMIKKSKRLLWDEDIIYTVDLDDQTKEDLIWSLSGLVEPKLAKAWPKFVNATRRMKTLEGKRLLEILSQFKEPKIFDAASGVGAETVWLRKRKYNVIPNEIVWEFIKSGQELAAKRLGPNHVYEAWAYDWRHLKQKLGEGLFDVVLVLGNSLTCLPNPREMKKCLEGFHHILKPEGILVIDTRNYKYMLDHRDQVTRRGFRFRHEVIYPSEEIRAKPDDVPRKLGRRMWLAYYDDGNLVGKWEVYAYDELEMEQLLEQENFTIEDRLFDFKKESDPDKPAEFITYIARVKK